FKVASSLPTPLRVNKYNTKYAMRKAAARHLPEEVAEKPKLGFPVPTRVWLRDEHYYHVVKDMFTSPTAEKFFNTDLLLQYLDEHFDEKEDNSRKIWTIYVFLVWYQIYFGAVAPEDLAPAERPAPPEPVEENETEDQADVEPETEEQSEENGNAEGTKVFTPVKNDDLPDELPLPEQKEEKEEDVIEPVPAYEEIYSSSGNPTARRVNLEAESKPISFTDDIDPEDFFASLKDKLRENIDDE
ncbi:MAG TPA: asparagine synthetase B, partial [Ruminococcaceae bacterium]|nr:asparagine synthetase B [Oscillospiraceae bacterium]